MKYWIFQSNQVLGPYDPDDLSRHSAFGAESLVCPEGRKGTSMGDWQRAGMVPDLSVALVRASQSNGTKTSVATLAGLPPEPTLKDLAAIGDLQEKMSTLEEVVLQLQEAMRVKETELASLQQELAGKDRQSSAMKTALEREAEILKLETEERKREAEELRAQADAFKRKVAELEDRVVAVNRLSETIDKAVEAEKSVEQDVAAQGATIAEFTRGIEALRAQLNERLSVPPPAPPEPAPAPAPAPVPEWQAPAAALEMPSIAPRLSPPLPAPEPEVAIGIPSETPTSSASSSPMDPPFPAFGDAGAMPSFASSASQDSLSTVMDPLSGALPQPAPVQPSEPAAEFVPAPPPKSRKKALLAGGLSGLVALGAFVFFSGGRKEAKTASTPASMPPAAPVSAPAPSAPVPPPPAAPAVDPREAAITSAKGWTLPDGRLLGQALETLSPPVGNLSPWMAEPLTGDRFSVNYFAHGGGAGAPTVAYEFEVDLEAKTVVGRNPAAKAVIAGKAAPPPAPPKAKRVALKPKKKAAKAAPKTSPAPKADAALPVPAVAPPDSPIGDMSDTDAGAAAKPAKPTTAKRAAKASAHPAPAASGGKAADEALLDDILKE